ncbi:ORF_106 [Adoxophyes orana granulovirus]|uniref:ADOR107 n=1 Tax=Adoxophyes orana granulovirus TaxID=170617 RepID=Q7T9Q9_GVAO|nr:ORF_106 [Adoxophyes orana granulovirus]AAP85743.1 ORF_106 [Adoxophyes orana granulovirus]AJA91747.1 ADOR107 [Adoxophyes orana granulovirus]
MILYVRKTFGEEKVSIVVEPTTLNVYFKLKDVLRILYKNDRHVRIDETNLKIFQEFPRTKYANMEGLVFLCIKSPLIGVAKNLHKWAQSMEFCSKWNINVVKPNVTF